MGGQRADASTAEETIDPLRRQLLRVISPLLWVAGLVIVAFTAREWPDGPSFPWLLVELVGFAITLGIHSSRAALHWKVRSAVGLFVLVSGVAVLHFGPTVGTGLFFLAAMLAATFLLELPGVLLTFACLSAAFGAAVWGAFAGWLAPVTFAPEPVSWLRMFISVEVVLAGIGGAAWFIRVQTRRSMEAERQARQREREAHAERERALQAVESSQRLEALGRLAGGVGHDINNALLLIQNGVELLRQSSEERERRGILDEMQQGIARATSTSRRLLAFARGNAEAAGSCDPARQLEGLARSLARVLPPGVALKTELQGGAWLPLSAGALEQVIVNLVLNARDALPRGGTIWLRCGATDGRAWAEVADDGEGIAPEVLPRVFEPFFSTKGEKGNGLGLSMVWGLVTKAGGEVVLSSVRGAGCTVRLWLPLVPARVEAPALPEAPAPLTGARILLLEDEPGIARGIVRILSRAGHALDAVETVRDALSRLEAGDYDLLITDGKVPDGPVAPVIAAFRRERREAPVILCTGYVEVADALTGVAREHLLVLAKPFAPPELLAVVRCALTGEPLPAPAEA